MKQKRGEKLIRLDEFNNLIDALKNPFDTGDICKVKTTVYRIRGRIFAEVDVKDTDVLYDVDMKYLSKLDGYIVFEDKEYKIIGFFIDDVNKELTYI